MNHPSNQQPESQASLEQTQESQSNRDVDMVDARDLVTKTAFSEDRGSISDDPREIINNPAVAPQALDSTPENLRDDLYKSDSAS